eukprot:4548512-Prymnesium_polylepis.1
MKLRHPGSNVCCNAVTAAARETDPIPNASAFWSAPCRAAYPISATKPQFTLWPHTPEPRRQIVMASSHALALECGDCPDEPMSPATEENTLKKRRGSCAKAACRAAPACTLGPYVARKLSACWLARVASASACAAWKTPRRLSPSLARVRKTRRTLISSAASQRTRLTSLLHAASHSQSLSLPVTTLSLRDESKILSSPASTSKRAVSSPRPPSPPEMNCTSSCLDSVDSQVSKVEGVCATRTAWPRKNLSPCMQCALQKPLSMSSPCHCRQHSSGLFWPTRSASPTSEKNHQPSVKPKVVWKNAEVYCSSLATTKPPGRSRRAQFDSVLTMNGVACSTFVPMTISH